MIKGLFAVSGTILVLWVGFRMCAYMWANANWPFVIMFWSVAAIVTILMKARSL